MNYRDYVDQIMEGVQALAGVVSDKGKKVASETKTRFNIKVAELERDKAYKSFGRVMYQIEQGSLKRDEDIIAAACKQIKEQEEAIATLKQELANEESAKDNTQTEESTKDSDSDQAPKQEKQSNDADIDSHNAPTQEEAEPVKKAEKNEEGYFVMKFCPHCGVGNHPDADHCISCGREI